MTSQWRKSSRSGGMGQCLEARAHNGKLQIRDSKLGETSPVLSMSGSDFTGLLVAIGR